MDEATPNQQKKMNCTAPFLGSVAQESLPFYWGPETECFWSQETTRTKDVSC